MKKVLGFILLCGLAACGGSTSSSGNSEDSLPNGSTSEADALLNDTQKPTVRLSINENAPTANSSRVSLKIEAEDNNNQLSYFVSQENQIPSVNTTGWVSLGGVTSSVDFTLNNFLLSSGGGSKSAFVWVKDAAGNISDVASDSIDVWGFQDLSEFCGDPADVDIAIDSQDKVHIVCKNGNGIYYITNQSGVWASQTIDDRGGVYVSAPSIVIDSHDTPHIVFNSWRPFGPVPIGVLQYARKNLAGNWDTTIVQQGPYSSLFVGNTSLVIDRNDKLHFTTFLQTLLLGTKTLWYVNNVSGSWQFDTAVEPSSFPSDNPQADLTVDNAGPRICYSQGGQLVYAKKVGSIWNRLSDFLLRDGINCSIVSDRYDGNWIAYHDIQNALNVISFDAGVAGASTNFLKLYGENAFTVGKYLSLAISNDQLYVAFFDALNNALYYTAQGEDGQDWFTLLIDSAGIQDLFPLKLAVDSDKKLHLVYYKMPGAKLMYATTR